MEHAPVDDGCSGPYCGLFVAAAALCVAGPPRRACAGFPENRIAQHSTGRRPQAEAMMKKLLDANDGKKPAAAAAAAKPK